MSVIGSVTAWEISGCVSTDHDGSWGGTKGKFLLAWVPALVTSTALWTRRSLPLIGHLLFSGSSHLFHCIPVVSPLGPPIGWLSFPDACRGSGIGWLSFPRCMSGLWDWLALIPPMRIGTLGLAGRCTLALEWFLLAQEEIPGLFSLYSQMSSSVSAGLGWVGGDMQDYLCSCSATLRLETPTLRLKFTHTYSPVFKLV